MPSKSTRRVSKSKSRAIKRKSNKTRRVGKKQRGGAVKCPNCKSTNTTLLSAIQAKYKCNGCGKEFTNTG